MRNLSFFLVSTFMLLGFTAKAQVPSRVEKPTEWMPNTTVLKSPDGRYHLSYQGDGNLVIYKNGNNAIWSTKTDGKTPKLLSFQGDGNFVLYGYNPKVVWATYSQGKGGKFIQLQNDGNLVIYTKDNKPIWNTPTIETNR